MLTLGHAWAGLALPMLLTAAMLLVAWRATRRRIGAGASHAWAAPLAIGVGFAGGYWSLFGTSGVPPADVTDWLPLVALAAAAWGMCDASALLATPISKVAILLAPPLTMLLFAWPILKSGAQTEFDLAPVVTIATGLTIVWVLLVERLATRISAARSCVLQLAASVPAAAALALSGSQKLGQAAGCLAATQAATFVVCGLLGRARLGRGTELVCGLIYAGLLLCGLLYAELTAFNGLLLFLAPLAAWIVQPWAGRYDAVYRTVLQVGLVAVLAMWAVTRAYLDHQAAASDYY